MKIFSNNQKLQGDDVKTEKSREDKIKQIKDFYPKSEDIFVSAFTAITQFREIIVANKNSDEASAQLINKDIDKDCQGNFAAVSATLEEDYLNNEDPEIANGMLEALHENLEQLHKDLTLFQEADNDAGRKKQYQDAIDLVDEIDAVCTTILPPKTSLGMDRGKS